MRNKLAASRFLRVLFSRHVFNSLDTHLISISRIVECATVDLQAAGELYPGYKDFSRVEHFVATALLSKSFSRDISQRIWRYPGDALQNNTVILFLLYHLVIVYRN